MICLITISRMNTTTRLDGHTCSAITASTSIRLLYLNSTLTVQQLQQCLIVGSIAMAPHTGIPMMLYPSKSTVKSSTLPHLQAEKLPINSQLDRTSAYNSDHSCSTSAGLWTYLAGSSASAFNAHTGDTTKSLHHSQLELHRSSSTTRNLSIGGVLTQPDGLRPIRPSPGTY